MTTEALDRWAYDTTAAAYAQDLVLTFNNAGWPWRVSTADRPGGQTFHAHLDGVTVESDAAGVRVTVGDVVVREFPRGAPADDVLAAATDANNSTEEN